MILKKKEGKLSTMKKAILLLGYNSEDNEPIMVNGKTRSFMDANLNKAEAELSKRYSLPTKALKIGQMSAEHRELYNLSAKSSETNTMIIVHDTENPKYVESQNKMFKMKLAIKVATYFDLDERNEYEDGTSVTGWNQFNLKKDDYLGMAEYLISEEGLGLSEEALNDVWTEINSMVDGLPTNGESIYKTMLLQMKSEQEQKEILDSIESEIDENGAE